MDERDFLAEHFEEYRTRLGAVAYRMIGSPSEADDAVQEEHQQSRESAGWLTTDVAKVCLEAEETIGGGARSAEMTLPGFGHDLGSAIHPSRLAICDHTPLYRLQVKIQTLVAMVHFSRPTETFVG